MYSLGLLCCLVNEPHFLSVFLRSRGGVGLEGGVGGVVVVGWGHGDLGLIVGEGGRGRPRVNNVSRVEAGSKA